MKRPLLLIFLLTALSQWSCTDRCEQTRRYKRYTPVTLTVAQVRQGIRSEAARELVNPGKIYAKGNYLFINELKQGLHIIDNTNPAAPRKVAFLAIPGNGDLAVRGNILYADSYMDLVALNIADPLNVKEVGRVGDVFQSGQFDGAWWHSSGVGSVTLSDSRMDIVTETIKTDCENNGNSGIWRGGWLATSSFDSRALSSAAPATSGQAGSMARFALYDRYLYTVSQSDMQLFDIKNLEQPQRGAKINMGWGIETIFPYKDKLFIGSNSGMFIYDNANPSKPTLLSTFQHAFACDPVVVTDTRAYVTLRSGTNCRRGSDQLDVIDITNLSNPTLIKTYPMQNPHGLGVDLPNLFICEGKHGLKSFDISSDLNVKQLEHLNNMDAYDVILLPNKLMLMIGKDGLYQFDYANPSQLRQVSVIPVKRLEI
ncbi:MAG: hypothetical protein EAZ14_07910 [Runella slithyformis]|jgi:hypothetical protein|nr:MAG: hypothetical protein EAZ14_07910 [Runella slithyformis]